MKLIITASMLIFVLAMTGSASGQATTPIESTAPVPAVVVQLEDEINDYTRDDLIRRFKEARDLGAKAVILEIDSYGGAVIPGLETSRFIKQQNDLRVTAFVSKKAVSAGAMVAVACNAIWMAPHSYIGDCGVIAVGPEGLKELGPTERAKFESPVVEDFRDSAGRNGYNTLLLESMVVVGREVYYVQNKAGEKRFVDGEGYTKLRNEGWEPVIPDRNPIDSKDSLLTLNADIAEKVGLARIASSVEEVASRCNYQIVGRFERTIGDRLIALLSSSGVRSLLITGLIICIYLAFKIPGAGLAEAGIAICLGLLLGVPLMTGYASWWEIVLVLLGVVLLAMEIFVIPGTAIAGFAGALCIVVGLIMTFIPKQPVNVPGILPSMPAAWEGLERGLVVMGVSMAAALVGCGAIAKFLPSMPLFGRLVLTKTVGGGQGDEKGVVDVKDAVAAIAWVKIGDEGETLTDLRPGGTARFPDPTLGAMRATDVLCDSGFIPAKTKIIVHELQGSTVVVRRAQS